MEKQLVREILWYLLPLTLKCFLFSVLVDEIQKNTNVCRVDRDESFAHRERPRFVQIKRRNEIVTEPCEDERIVSPRKSLEMDLYRKNSGR